MRNLSANGALIGSGGGVKTDELLASQASRATADSVSQKQQEIAAAQEQQFDDELATQWVREFQTMESGAAAPKANEKVSGSFWEDLQDEWNLAAT